MSNEISRSSECTGVLEEFLHRKLLVKCLILRSEVSAATSVKITLM